MLYRLGHARLDFLDQMRALAIVSVVIQHLHSNWLPGGGIGVGIFFALSGFLVATILLEEKRLDRASATAFLIRRFMRIYPAYLAAITANVVLAYLDHPERTGALLSALPGLLTFTGQPRTPLGYGISVLWTLQVEMSFYLSMPVAMLVFGRRRGILILSGLLLAASLLLSPLQYFGPSLLHWGAALAFGALVSVAWKSELLKGSGALAATLVAAALVGIAILLALPPTPWAAWVGEIMAGSLCGCALICAFLMRPSLPVLWGAAWIGRISYSLYLIHGIAIDHQDWLVGHTPSWIGNHHRLTFAAIIIGASAASYYLIERPGIRAGKILAAALARG